jgi:hypothetical protein
MEHNYESPFRDLRVQIRDYSPGSIPSLDRIESECGSKIAYYAAFVLVCVHAKQKQAKSAISHAPSADDLKDFTFFTVAQDNPAALALFDELLVNFNHEHTTQPHISHPHFDTDRPTPDWDDAEASG